MRLNIRLTCVLCIILCSLLRIEFLDAQSTYSFQHLDQSTGLSGNTVFRIAQDTSGFMWFASNNGLQRYDGYHFITYLHDPGDSFSLPSNLIEDVLADRYNNIWVVTSPFSVYMLDRYKQRFLPVLSKEQHVTIRYLSLSPQHEIWATGSEGVFKYNYSEKKFIPVASLNGPDAERVISPLVFDPSHPVGWFATVQGVFLLDLDSKKIYNEHAAASTFHILLKGQIQNLYAGKQGDLWISSYAGELVRFNKSENKLSYFDEKMILKLTHDTISSGIFYSNFCEDEYGHLWISTYGGGILMYDYQTNGFRAFQYFPWDPKSIRYDFSVFNVEEDRDGNIWAGTDEGVSYFSPTPSLFANFFYHPSDLKSFPDAPAESFLKIHSGEIWITTSGGGIVRCDSQLNIESVYNGTTISGSKPYAPYDKYWSLAEDHSGKIWIGGHYGYLSVFDPVSNSFSNSNPEVMHNSAIKQMRRDTSGNVWFGLRDGSLIEWNSEKKKYISYDSLLTAHHLMNNIIYDMLIDAHNNIWMAAGGNGLIRFDPTTRSVNSYIPFDEAARDVTVDSNVLCVNRFNDSLLVIGTLNNGVYLFNPATHLFHRLKPVNGLFSTYITGVCPVNHTLWVATLNGLSSLDLRKLNLVKYTEADGLQNNSFNAEFSEIGNHLLIGYSNGFLSINPSSSFHTAKAADVKITGISLFDHALRVDSIMDHHLPVELSYKQNFLTIDFVCPTYFETHTLFYSYRLKGVDPDWRIATDNPQAVYTNLQGGTYVFEVRSENSDNEIGKTTQLIIIIQPPFWQTTWFYILLVVILLMIILTTYFIRVRQIRKKEFERSDNERRIQEMKLTVLRTQLNPHFMFNSLNAIHNFILKNDEEQATSYLSKFAKLMRMVLDTSQQNLIPLQEELGMLKLYLELENLRLSNTLRYEINVDPEINLMETQVPPLLIQPCLENAIWHGLMQKENNRQLLLAISTKGNLLYFHLGDNGIGREEAMKIKGRRASAHDSKGIAIVDERLELMGRQMNVKSFMEITDVKDSTGQPAGTSVKVGIPFIKKNPHNH